MSAHHTTSVTVSHQRNTWTESTEESILSEKFNQNIEVLIEAHKKTFDPIALEEERREKNRLLPKWSSKVSAPRTFTVDMKPTLSYTTELTESGFPKVNHDFKHRQEVVKEGKSKDVDADANGEGDADVANSATSTIDPSEDQEVIESIFAKYADDAPMFVPRSNPRYTRPLAPNLTIKKAEVTAIPGARRFEKKNYSEAVSGKSSKPVNSSSVPTSAPTLPPPPPYHSEHSAHAERHVEVAPPRAPAQPPRTPLPLDAHASKASYSKIVDTIRSTKRSPVSSDGLCAHVKAAIDKDDTEAIGTMLSVLPSNLYLSMLAHACIQCSRKSIEVISEYVDLDATTLNDVCIQLLQSSRVKEILRYKALWPSLKLALSQDALMDAMFFAICEEDADTAKRLVTLGCRVKGKDLRERVDNDVNYRKMVNFLIDNDIEVA